MLGSKFPYEKKSVGFSVPLSNTPQEGHPYNNMVCGATLKMRFRVSYVVFVGGGGGGLRASSQYNDTEMPVCDQSGVPLERWVPLSQGVPGAQGTLIFAPCPCARLNKAPGLGW